MEHKNLKLQGNTLEVKFVCQCSATDFDKRSLEFVVGGNIAFQVRIIACRHFNGIVGNYGNIGDSSINFVTVIFVRFRNQRSNENYNVKFTCNEFAIKDKWFNSDDGTWHLIYENRKNQGLFTFNVSVVIDAVLPAVSFASLHEDEEFTDFELRGEDGSVKVHKTILAAVSPVLRRMLCGTWRETTEGYIEVKGNSKATLQYLKDYIYLSTLPENGLEELLLLASYYMMPELKQRCIDKLVTMNACELMVAAPADSNPTQG